jgi:hypothetical protein
MIHFNIVTHRLFLGNEFGKHVSAEIRFLDTNHRWVLNVSMDRGMEVIDSWKTVRCRRSKNIFREYR